MWGEGGKRGYNLLLSGKNGRRRKIFPVQAQRAYYTVNGLSQFSAKLLRTRKGLQREEEMRPSKSTGKQKEGKGYGEKGGTDPVRVGDG